MMNSKSSVIEAISEAGIIGVAAHVKPDGDAIGSVLGTVSVLRENNKTAYPIPIDKPPYRYFFLKHFNELFDELPFMRPDIILGLDFGDVERLFPQALKLHRNGTPLVIVDHHKSNKADGVARWVDGSYAATSIMLLEIFQEMEYSIPTDAAQAFYTALAADTGQFCFANADAPAFAAAAEMVKLGASPVVVSRKLTGENSVESMYLLGESLKTLKRHLDGKIISMVVTHEMIKSTGASENDLENLAGFPRSIEGAKVGLLFRQISTGFIHVSFRSNDGFDVRSVAEKLGGGGHRAAAGTKIEGTLDNAMKIVIRELEKLL